jgi:hypothetical protein
MPSLPPRRVRIDERELTAIFKKGLPGAGLRAVGHAGHATASKQLTGFTVDHSEQAMA